MYITKSKRLVDLTSDMYELIERPVIESRKEKKDIVDLSAGTPHLSPPAPIVKELFRQVRKPGSQRYTAAGTIPELRRAVALWYRSKLGVVLNP
jgi:alanine-synthesizing transaminase